MSDVPSDLCREILSRVPAEALLRLRCVCKVWHGIIDDPDFIKLHLHRQNGGDRVLIRKSVGIQLYSVSLKSLTFSNTHSKTIWAAPVKPLIRRGIPRLPVLPVASCNGLILIPNPNEKRIWVLWNPLTREFRELPLYVPSEWTGNSSCGLGYDSVSDDYKVVRIARFLNVHNMSETLVYSLKLNSWRRINDFPGWNIVRGDGTVCPGFFFNGALHWLSYSQGGELHIIALDLGTEKYRHLSTLPSGIGMPDWYMNLNLNLTMLGGCLFLIHHFNGWIMNEYGVSDSWTKLFSFGDFPQHISLGRHWPVAYLRSKGLLLIQYYGQFFWFNVEKKMVQRVAINANSPIYNFTAQVFSGSLVRLNSAAECAAKRKRKRKLTID